MFAKITVLMTSLLFAGLCFAQAPVGKAIAEELNIYAKEVQKRESGEVLTKLASEYEQSRRELTIDSTILFRKPLSELAAASEDKITPVPGLPERRPGCDRALRPEPLQVGFSRRGTQAVE